METEIGKITHFFNKISVAVLSLSGQLKIGDKIKIKSGGEEFEQIVDSMQIEHNNIEIAEAGQEIGLKTIKPVSVGALVYKVEE